MLKKIDSAGLGASDLGWLRSRFHFSFAEYHDPMNVHFGVLRVLNDDLVAPGRGFDMHPHSDFEILSYVVDGALTHGDSMGNAHTLTRGEVQYMSAGSGVLHSEHNLGDKTLRFLQVWLLPDEKGRAPAYGDYRFDWEARKDRWLLIASGPDGGAPVTSTRTRDQRDDSGRSRIGFAVAPARVTDDRPHTAARSTSLGVHGKRRLRGNGRYEQRHKSRPAMTADYSHVLCSSWSHLWAPRRLGKRGRPVGRRVTPPPPPLVLPGSCPLNDAANTSGRRHPDERGRAGRSGSSRGAPAGTAPRGTP